MEQEAADLLARWVKQVEWQHTGSFGRNQAWACPFCRERSEYSLPFHRAAVLPDRNSIQHAEECLLGMTLIALGTREAPSLRRAAQRAGIREASPETAE